LLRLRGNWKPKLGELIARAKRISHRAVEESADLVADEAHSLAEEGQRQQVNPQGRKWRNTRDAAPLTWPRKARVVAVVRGTRIAIEVRGPEWVSAQHSGANQRRGEGRWRIPARRIVPGGTLPKRWAVPIMKHLKITWRQFLEGRAPSVKRARRKRRR
jgi:hypothetical protein